MFEQLQKLKKFWSFNGPKNDIVISSRIRLARNMHTVSFPGNLEDNEIDNIRSISEKFINESEFRNDLSIIELNGIEKDEKRLLRERNLITQEMEDSIISSVIINSNEDFQIFVNEEDHFRIQIIRPGLQLMEAYRIADRVDNELNRFVVYSYSDDYGYLTTCPTNLGTGLKVSVILHLPVLSLRRKVLSIMPKVKKRNAEMKGIIGENNISPGCLYQISNKVSLGVSEVDIIELMDEIVNNVFELEDRARDEYVSKSRLDIENKVWRSYGLLKYSRKISYTEAMENISNVRLGIILGIITKIEINFLNDLMVNIQYSHLLKNFGINNVKINEVDEIRAEYIMNCLS